MPCIELSTFIAASPQACYALALNTQAHVESARQTGERVLAGPPGGQLQPSDVVTWEGRHFGLRQRLTVRITAATPPTHFRDELVRGTFRQLRHDHYFEAVAGGTLMRDVFAFQSPAGFVGRWFERLFLTRYLTDFLRQRNAVLKQRLEEVVGKPVTDDVEARQYQARDSGHAAPAGAGALPEAILLHPGGLPAESQPALP